MKKLAGASIKFSNTLALLVAAVILLLFFLHSFFQRLLAYKGVLCKGRCHDHVTGFEKAPNGSLASRTNFENIHTAETIQTPPPLSLIHSISKSQFATLSNHSLFSPLVFKAYVRPSLNLSANHPNDVDIFLFTLSLYFRNLTVSHCLVGDKLYPVQSYSQGVTLCTAPYILFSGIQRDNATVTVVIDRRSEGFRSAMSDDVELGGGQVARPLVLGRDIKPYRLLPSSRDRVVPSSESDAKEFLRDRTDLLLAIPSDLTVGNILIDDFDPVHVDAKKRYAVCMMTMTATSPHLIVPWVDYHRTLGVDHVYLFNNFNNGLEGDLHSLLSSRPDVEVVAWPWKKSQNIAVSFALLAARRRCDILFKQDTDEFVLLGASPNGMHQPELSAGFANGRRPLHSFLQHRRARLNGKSLELKRLKVCNSGYVHVPSDPPPLAYTHVRQEDFIGRGKSFCETMSDYRRGDVHSCGLVGSELKYAGLGLEVSADEAERLKNDVDADVFWGKYAAPTTVSDVAWIMHFYERSWEEWTEKWSIGGASAKNTKRDKRIGKFNASLPDSEFIDKDNKRCREYSFFKRVFQNVMTYKDERVKQAVLVWNENSTAASIVVSK